MRDQRDLPGGEAEAPSEARSLAMLLHAASPARAADFARAMHERACMRADEADCALWAEVLDHCGFGCLIQTHENDC